MNGNKACNMRSLNEKHLEQAFIRAMNKVIGGRESFLETLLQNIYRGLEKIEEEYTVEQLDARLEELQREMMSLVRLDARTGLDTRVYDRCIQWLKRYLCLRLGLRCGKYYHSWAYSSAGWG